MSDIRLRVELRHRDIDVLGHLNQSVYHELLEEGRMALLEPEGGDTGPFVLARVELDYRHEVRHADEYVTVLARVSAMGRTSVTVTNEVLLPDGTIAAEGKAILVAWDPEARSSRELSDAERSAFR
jgi:acyl-CoA thioester hydrolase